jgi:hypothetical protein
MYCLKTNKRKWGGATLYTSDISSGKAKRAEWTFITLKCPKVELCSLDIDLLTGTYIYQFLDWFGSTKQLMTGTPSIACSKTYHGSPSQQGNTSWWRDLKILCKLSNKWNGLFFLGQNKPPKNNSLQSGLVTPGNIPWFSSKFGHPMVPCKKRNGLL